MTDKPKDQPANQELLGDKVIRLLSRGHVSLPDDVTEVLGRILANADLKLAALERELAEAKRDLEDERKVRIAANEGRPIGPVVGGLAAIRERERADALARRFEEAHATLRKIRDATACPPVEPCIDVFCLASETLANDSQSLALEQVRAERETLRTLTVRGLVSRLADGTCTVSALGEAVFARLAEGDWPLDAVQSHGAMSGKPSDDDAAAALPSRDTVLPVESPGPIPMLLRCPYCNARHVDRGEWATKPHRTHLCGECGREWRPANVPTVGVAELPPEKPQRGEG